MSDKNSAQNVIQSYRKRQQMGPFLIGGLAVVLVVVGIIILVVWLAGPNKPALALFATKTPTSTSTFTPTPVTPTATASMTSTVTDTPMPSITPTPTGPFEYTVLEGDTCFGIAEKFNVDVLVLLALNNFQNTCPIQVGQKIYIPAPDTKLDTPTPIPTGFRGDINYVVQSGDTLGTIAAKFNSTVDSITTKNKLTSDSIQVGQTLIISVNIATAVPTQAPTSTPNLSLLTKVAATPTLGATATSAATATRLP